MKKIYVIGDIHGMYEKFMQVLNQINIQKEDYVIFLGDYIDRGQQSLETLKKVYELQQQYKNVHCLKGNHELMLLEYLTKHNNPLEARIDTQDNYIFNGGLTTLMQLQEEYAQNPDFVLTLIEWIKQLPYHIMINNMHFSHAGCNATRTRQRNEDFVWCREEFLLHYKGEEDWFIGHTPVQFISDFINDKPPSPIEPIFTSNHIIMMDTGSYLPNGKISCYEITTDTIYQSS